MYKNELKCKECGGLNFRTVRENHEPVAFKCVKCGALSPLKKSAVKSGLEKLNTSEELENGI